LLFNVVPRCFVPAPLSGVSVFARVYTDEAQTKAGVEVSIRKLYVDGGSPFIAEARVKE